ncbi:MAG: hypothetical protein IT303_00465 [Dehalococcoidia bacterium]|nr:hypothetical protein [Dehalococcoidia bacterium]
MTARWTRRRFLAGGSIALVAAGGAAAGVVAATRDGGGAPRASASPTPTPSPPTTSTPIPATPTATPEPAPSGVLRVPAAVGFNFDTFDAQRAGEPTVAEVLGRTHSRLVQWREFGVELEPDLAARWEQADELTLVLHLAPGARWHDRAPLHGRAVTAEDVAAHLRRAVELARTLTLPATQRATDYLGIARVAAIDATTVRIETQAPDPFLPGALAGRFALVQAPEAVDAFAATWADLAPAAVIGSGPFLFEGTGDDGSLRFVANPAGHRRARVAALDVTPPAGDPAAFLAREVDEFIARDRRAAQELRAAGAGFHEERREEDFNVISTLSVGGPPWDHPGLRLALLGALHRGELAARLFGGRALPALPVPGGAAGLSEQDIVTLPGYGPDFAAAAKDARARWEAAGGPALGVITIDFPSIFDPLYSASSVVTGMLNEVLGPQFRAAVETYTAISRKSIEGQYGNGRAAAWFGWAPAFTTPEPAQLLFERYHSSSAGAQLAGFADASIDTALEAAAATFDPLRRRELTRTALLALLRGGGGGTLDWLVQYAEVFRHDYVRGRTASSFWPQHRDAAASVDTRAPGYPDR